MTPSRAALWLVVLVAGCGREAPSVADAYGYAPLTADGAAVAYFVLRNPGPAPVVLTGADCPLFARTEFHATTLADGIADMQKLDELRVAAGSDMRFEPGGLHLMMTAPAAPVTAGTVCSIVLEQSDGSRLAFDVTLRDRAAEQRP